MNTQEIEKALMNQQNTQKSAEEKKKEQDAEEKRINPTNIIRRGSNRRGGRGRFSRNHNRRLPRTT